MIFPLLKWKAEVQNKNGKNVEKKNHWNLWYLALFLITSCFCCCFVVCYLLLMYLQHNITFQWSHGWIKNIKKKTQGTILGSESSKGGWFTWLFNAFMLVLFLFTLILCVDSILYILKLINVLTLSLANAKIFGELW